MEMQNTNLENENLLHEKNKIKKLMKNANEKEAELNNIRIKFLIEGNRYVTSSKKLKKDEIIVTIPSSVYFNRLLKNQIDDYYKQISDLEDSEQICIFLYFLSEFKKKENSEHYDYTACLPKDETYFPIFYSEENKNLLKGSIMINYMNKNIRKIKNEFELLKNKFLELKDIDFKEYLKVRLTLGARIFETDKSNHVNSAVPIADLFNFHPEKVNCCWIVDENNNFVVQAIKEIEEDEEIFLFYGNQDNIYFLFWYAFTITNNPENIKSYPIEFDDDQVLEFKINFEFSEVFEKYCHIRKFENYLSSNNILKNTIKMRKIFDILKDLKSILENRMKLYYNATIEKDFEDLENYVKINDFNKVNIMNVIIEEKSIIIEYIKILNLIIEMFIHIERGESIRSKFSIFLADYPNDKFVKFLFSNYKK